MKLISLYITAFGGVRDRAFTFRDGVTELLDRNGAGKSTLAAFIKVMLYGLEKSGNAIPDNEPSLYEPWQGGRFGGSLTLEHRGEVLRIERHYERIGKVKTQMTLRILNEATGLETDLLGEEPGRTLFGVDGPSFLRTAYLSSRGISAAKTADISARLGGLEGESDDMANVENAIKLLRLKRSEIRTQNKQKNGQKLLDNAERELRALEGEVAAARAAMDALPNAEAGAAEIARHLNALDTDITTLRAAKAQADRRRGEREAAERRLAELMQERAAALDALHALAGHFPDGAPSEEQLAALSADAVALHRLGEELRGESGACEERFPTDEEMTELRAAIRERREIRTRPFALEDPEKDAPPTDAPSRLPLILTVAGGVLAAIGLLLLFLSPIAGALLLAAGLALGATGLVLAVRARRAREARRVAEEQLRSLRISNAYREAIGAADERAARLLAAFGLAEDTDEAALDRLTARAAEARARAERTERLLATRAETGERLERELAAYRGLPTAPDPLVRIRALSDLTGQRTATEATLRRLETEIARLTAAAGAEPEEGPSPEQLAALLGECESRRRALTEKQTSAKEALERTRAVADTLPSLLDAEARITAEIAEHEARILTLDRTVAFLESARAAYEEAYLGGIRRHIGRYAEALFGDSMGEARLNLDLQLSFLSGGEEHSVLFESTGRRAVADICLRLALLDALYPTDPPPLILDDPFVALDEENLRTALSLLKALGRNRQILYLTCHPSRSLREV